MWFAELNLNSKFHEPTYNLIMDYSLYGYLSHYLWIALISYYILRPSGLESTAVAVTLEFIGTILMIGGSYYAILKVSSFCFPPKPKESSEENGKEGADSIASKETDSEKPSNDFNRYSPSMNSANAPLEEERESLLTD